MLDWDFDKNQADPLFVPIWSLNKFNWKCHKCNHEWEDLISNRKRTPDCYGCNSFGNIYPEKLKF